MTALGHRQLWVPERILELTVVAAVRPCEWAGKHLDLYTLNG